MRFGFVPHATSKREKAELVIKAPKRDIDSYDNELKLYLRQAVEEEILITMVICCGIGTLFVGSLLIVWFTSNN